MVSWINEQCDELIDSVMNGWWIVNELLWDAYVVICNYPDSQVHKIGQYVNHKSHIQLLIVDNAMGNDTAIYSRHHGEHSKRIMSRSISYRGSHFPRWLPSGNTGSQMRGTKSTFNSLLLIFWYMTPITLGEYNWRHLYKGQWHIAFFYCISHFPRWPPPSIICQCVNNKSQFRSFIDYIG